ncbi:hypothetical protein ACFL4D_02650 [Candidatus Margulisiibacteriota bacterium]
MENYNKLTSLMVENYYDVLNTGMSINADDIPGAIKTSFILEGKKMFSEILQNVMQKGDELMKNVQNLM